MFNRKIVQQNYIIMATNGDCRNLTMDSINQNIVKMEFVYRGALALRAAEIGKEVQQVCEVCSIGQMPK